MDMKQVLIFLLFLVPAWTSRCYNNSELIEAAKRRLRRHYVQPTKAPELPASSSDYSCPMNLYRTPLPKEQRDRSLSPWRYVLHIKEDLFPSEYVSAQCLCSGCIQLTRNSEVFENYDYNSAPIVQNKVFLKKVLCDDKKTYRLRPVNVEVAVGCTCVRPQSS